ncbi:DUF2142 domain-containing protein [Pseudomonas saliphila]|uniref:DUF2142 domain-containing protein n=1 Tax=Pseudomonas saliphila TaxID=2586906 RepID=UPI0015B3A6D0|nr:DUF2142 domain-containing protein [Pseudomonas saliphila]
MINRCGLKRVGSLYLGAVLLAAFFLSVIVPPLQSPDEFDHLKRAYMLSQGELFLSGPDGVAAGGLVDTGLLEYYAHYSGFPTRSDVKQSPLRLAEAGQIRWQGERVYSGAPGTGYYLPFIYIPQAVGFAIGEAVEFTVDRSYRLARLLTLASSVALFLAALSLVRPPFFALALLALPMTLFQLSAATLDGLSLALTFFAISAFVALVSEPDAAKRWLFPAFIISILLLTTSRIQLFPLLLLPFVVYVYTRQRNVLLTAVLLVVASLAWVAFAMSTTAGNRGWVGASSSTIVIYYLTDPLAFFALLARTIAHHWTFYTQSFIGVLGWLDAPLPEPRYRYIAAILVLILLCSLVRIDWKRDWAWRAALLCCALGSALLIFIAMLVTWTVHPADVIDGVQGRYFAPSVALFCFAVFSSGSRQHMAISVCGWLLLVLLLIYSLSAAATTILQRYYLPAPEGADYLLELTPSEPLSQDQPIVLSLADAPADTIVGLGIRFGTYMRDNQGQALLELQAVDGSLASIPFELAGLQDNRYRLFPLPPQQYVSAVIRAVEGGGISSWAVSRDGAAQPCVVYLLANGSQQLTPGCPAP